MYGLPQYMVILQELHCVLVFYAFREIVLSSQIRR